MPDSEGRPKDDGNGYGRRAGKSQALGLGHALPARQVDGNSLEWINENKNSDEDFEVFGEVFPGSFQTSC